MAGETACGTCGVVQSCDKGVSAVLEHRFQQALSEVTTSCLNELHQCLFGDDDSEESVTKLVALLRTTRLDILGARQLLTILSQMFQATKTSLYVSGLLITNEDDSKTKILTNLKHTVIVRKAVQFLSYVVWGRTCYNQRYIGWRHRWRTMVSDILLNECVIYRKNIGQSPVVSTWAVDHVWIPAATLSNVDSIEVEQLGSILRSLPGLSTAHCRIGPLIKSIFMCAAPIKLPQLGWSQGISSNPVDPGQHPLLSGVIPSSIVRVQMHQLLDAYGDQLSHTPRMLLQALLFWRRSGLSSLAVSNPAASVPELSVLLEHQADMVNVIRSTVPMQLFFKLLAKEDAPTFNIVFTTGGKGVAEPLSVATLEQDRVWMDLFNVLTDLPTHTKSHDTEWVMLQRQWAFWSRHPHLFHTLSKRFGAPLKWKTPSSSVNDWHHDWNELTPLMFGLADNDISRDRPSNFKNPLVQLRPNKEKKIWETDDEKRAVGSLWYSIASHWNGHKSFLGVCRPNADIPPAVIAASCNCPQCTVFRKGWHRAYLHYADCFTHILPNVITHIIWTFTLFDPRFNL